MTQQPFYPQQYPQAPQPQYQQPAQQPVQQAQPQYPSYPQQVQYQQPAQVPVQQPPAQPLANGSIDDFYNQPGTGGGPGISWKGKPEGTTYAGIVTRDVTQGDVQQDTDYTTKQPKFYRDGRPVFVMKVPLQGQPSQEFPDGEFAFYVRGQAREELVRAMAEAGCEGAPKAGAGIVVTLAQRKPTRGGGNPANIVRIQYTPPAGQAQAPAQQQSTEAPSPASVPAAPPAPQPVPEQPQYQPAPVQQQAPAPAQVQPQQAAQASTPQPPAGLSPEQQALLAQMTGQPAPGQA